MKPHVICHMAASVDGRTLSSRWRPSGLQSALYGRLHQRLGGQAWLVARITGQEFAKADPYPPSFATGDAPAWAVVLDAHGNIAWGQASSRRQVPAALRLFVDLVRELRPLGL